MGGTISPCRYQARWSAVASRWVLLALAITRTAALTQEYCADFNTGAAGKSSTNKYMTNGKCHDNCAGYAFGVVQYKNCWCTNTAPGGAGPGSSCSKPCPGYPFENCGEPAQGLYGYIALGPQPSSTQDGSSPSSSPAQAEDSSSAPSTPSPTPSTSVITSSQYVPVAIPLDSSSSSPTPTPTPSPTTSSKSSTSSPKSSSSWSPTPVVTLETVTGKLKTMTVTPSAPSAPPQSTETVVTPAMNSKAGSFFSSPGKVAGTFVAVALILVAILAGIAFFLWRRKRKADSETIPSTAGSGTPQRRPSRMSQMGLLGSQKEKGGSLPQIQTNGWGPGSSAEKSPADTLDKRSSYPRVVDQRLEPAAVWNPLHDNGSHVSVRSFKDDQDYSRRMLRIANPD